MQNVLSYIFADADKARISSTQIELDSTTQESLRTQYVPPEPKLKILSRPKSASPNPQANGVKSKKPQVTKSLQQVNNEERQDF